MTDACPHCGSVDTVTMSPLPDSDVTMCGCFACKALWEAVPDGETYLVDGELMPWRSPCDNCAFRAGSTESQDRVAWRALLDKLRKGGQFFCHKGVPIKQESVLADHRLEFDYPHDESDKPIREQLRLCRGFLNAWGRWEGIPSRDPR